jgi:hypothetical protein
VTGVPEIIGDRNTFFVSLPSHTRSNYWRIVDTREKRTTTGAAETTMRRPRSFLAQKDYNLKISDIKVYNGDTVLNGSE